MHAATCKWASYLGSGVTPDPMSSALLVLPRYTSWRKHSRGDMSNVWEASLKFAGYIDSYRCIDETALFLFLYQTRGHSHRWWERACCAISKHQLLHTAVVNTQRHQLLHRDSTTPQYRNPISTDIFSSLCCRKEMNQTLRMGNLSGGNYSTILNHYWVSPVCLTSWWF